MKPQFSTKTFKRWLYKSLRKSLIFPWSWERRGNVRDSSAQTCPSPYPLSCVMNDLACTVCMSEWVYMSNICLLLTGFVCDSKIGRDFSWQIPQKCDRREADSRVCCIIIIIIAMTFGLQSSCLCYLWAVRQQHASNLCTFQESWISLSLHCNSQLVFQMLFVLTPDAQIIYNGAKLLFDLLEIGVHAACYPHGTSKPL